VTWPLQTAVCSFVSTGSFLLFTPEPLWSGSAGSTPQVPVVVGVAAQLQADQVVVLGIPHAPGVAIGRGVEPLLLARHVRGRAHPGGVAARAADRRLPVGGLIQH
jgi:hypothetical protein